MPASSSQPAEEGHQSRVSVPWLIVGLGNPGANYASHRHNVGYLVVDELLARVGGALRMHKSRRAEVYEGRLRKDPTADSSVRVIFARSRSYMNESGPGVADLASFYKIPPEHLVVIHDELDIAFPHLRVKSGGGDNGHNGLRSIRATLGSGDFLRVRLGIGRPTTPQPVPEYVLSPHTRLERDALPHQLTSGADAVVSLVTRGLNVTQNAFNGPNSAGTSN